MKLIIFFAIGLIILDKLLTALVIKKVEKKYPNKNKFSVEKNPLAYYFFINFGILLGSILYGIVSLFTFFFCSWLLQFVIGWNWAFLIISFIYVLVIINNIRWYIKI